MPDLCATHRLYFFIGTGCFKAITFSRYSRAWSTVFPRSWRARSTDFFHASGSPPPVARDVAAVRAHGLLGPVLADLLDEREAFLIDAAHEGASGPRRQ